MERTRAPFVVLKPVLTTIAKATASSSWPSCGRLARIILVPLKRKCLAASELMELALRSNRNRVSFVAGVFVTGTDSPGPEINRRDRAMFQVNKPVSILSFTIQSPARSRLSQGNCSKEGSEISYTSPGTRSVLATCRPVSNQYFLKRRVLKTHKIHFVKLSPHTRSVKALEDVSLSVRQLRMSRVSIFLQIWFLVMSL